MTRSEAWGARFPSGPCELGCGEGRFIDGTPAQKGAMYLVHVCLTQSHLLWCSVNTG